MPRFINPDKISMRVPCNYDEEGNLMVSLADVKKAIAQTPSEDVVEVVRCADCESYDPASPTCGNCHRTTYIMHPTDFCSRGKRKEDKV